MIKSQEVLSALQSIVDKGVVNCANIASGVPLTIAIPTQVFNDACEICVRAKSEGIAPECESDIGDGDSDTESPDPSDEREMNFSRFKTPKEALKYYYEHHLEGRHTECYEFYKELKIIEWLYSKKGL